MSKKEFWLGEIVRKYYIAGFDVIEYHPRISDGSVLSDEVDRETTSFSVENENHSFSSLARAIVYIGLRMGGSGINEAPRLTGVLFGGIGE
jgi:hypothetical protein